MTNRRRKEIASLKRKKGREALGQFLVEGVRSVEAALAAQAPLAEVLVSEAVQDDAPVQALTTAAAQANVHLDVLPPKTFEALSTVETSQGVLAVARAVWVPLHEVAGCRRLLLLDAVQDPGNVGTLLRTAAWFGIDAVVAGPGTVEFFNPKVVRAAMGGLWDVHLVQADDLADALQTLRTHGVRLYGADLEGTDARAWQPAVPSALVLGSEAHGLSEPVQRLLDERITIVGSPKRQGAESLNVAVAAGILMHTWALLKT